MSRRPLHFLSLISAVIWALSLLLVVRSFWWSDTLGIPASEQRTYVVCMIDAQLLLIAYPEPRESFVYEPVRVEPLRPVVGRVWANMTGVRWLGFGWGTAPGGWSLVLPLWLIPATAALLPARWSMIRMRQTRQGFPVEAVKMGAFTMATENTADEE